MIILFEVKNHPYTTIFSLVGVGADDIYENHTMRQKVNFANFWRNLSCHSNKDGQVPKEKPKWTFGFAISRFRDFSV